VIIKIKAWFWAVRPFSISAAVVPVLAGSAFAFTEGIFNVLRFILVLTASVLIQITTNLVDEYADHARPEGGQKILAPYKVIALGLLTGKEVKQGALICFSLASAIGLYLVYVSGLPVLIMCLASALAAYFYSAGPRPLGKIGLGQPLVFIFMGVVMVTGSFYVQTHYFTSVVFLLSLPVGFTVTTILAANDIRDMEEDRGGRKNTIVTAFGRKAAWWEYLFLVSGAFLTVIILVSLGSLHPASLLVLLALPQAVLTLRILKKGRNRPELAGGVPASSSLHLYFGVLLTAGILFGHFIG
jgi:1,4-dihydroxy-2-naphthoate octaprenyltransferase